MIQRSYDGSPTFYVIPTPIGNLEDITLRTIKILKEVKVIFAEDTRETQVLLNHLKIKKKLISNNEFNEQVNKEQLLKYLNKGYQVGLVSDRGTPAISDPGYKLIRSAIDNKFNIVVLPGPTAFVPALIASGLEVAPFLFYGFLNKKENSQLKQLETLKYLKYTLIFYESPYRVEKTLKTMLKILGNRQISISREISKKFAEVYRGSISEVLKQLKTLKGEFVIVVEGNKEKNNYENLTIIEHVNLYIKEGYDNKEAIKKVSLDRKVPKRIIYNNYHNITKDEI